MPELAEAMAALPMPRFWSRVVEKLHVPALGPCWLWVGAPHGDGYGGIKLDRRVVSVHRLLWQAVNGPVPEGLELDHLCTFKRCVRPSHLEPVTHRENLLRMVRRAAAALP